ncbi:MAG TPA: BlaI/MecI/CopY family transcriptional regulator [Phycisphaerales bacterium]|nr:BlaI/MecI/CopY family transcriptional regulator [Phycisphaerales bacterium]
MTKRSVELGEAELAVMRVLWDGGPLAVREVMNRLHELGKTVAYTTVQTFLTRLEQKGVVASDKRDTAFVYRARISRESVSASRIRTLVNQLYDGAAAPMLLHLIENERFSPEEIAQLRKLIDDLDARNKGRNKG